MQYPEGNLRIIKKYESLASLPYMSIVTGIAAGKKILIFDEPTSGLDYDLAAVFGGKVWNGR